MKVVAYYRVSTARQGRSGLGLSAQKTAIATHCRAEGWQIVADFTEIESGTKNDRNQLAAAMEACHLHGATLAIARLDRLSRDASFLLSLQSSGINFAAVDMPAANRLTIGIMSVIAQDEAERISLRTKLALRQAKIRGTKLGGRRSGSHNFTAADREASATARREKSRKANAAILAEIKRIQSAGIVSANGIAKELNRRKIPTINQREWQAVQIIRLLANEP